jgi:hypothetical protein
MHVDPDRDIGCIVDAIHSDGDIGGIADARLSRARHTFIRMETLEAL